jgi:integrase
MGKVARPGEAMKITFAQQAEKFLKDGTTRKRNPLRPATIRSYRSHLDSSLLPLIGKLSLESVGNKAVSEVVQKLSEQGYSPRTIGVNVFIIKKIRKSAVNEDGEQLYPTTWNTDMIDAPSVGDTKQPTVSAQQVQDAISKADTHRKALYAVLAGTGLRIAEARALKLLRVDDQISSAWLPDQSKIAVRQQMTRDGLAPTKTRAGLREVDLAPDLNNFLKYLFAVVQPGGLMFDDCENCYRDHLAEDGIIGGFHTFRRFRVTHLRMSGVPDPLVKYWTGHAAGNVTEQYTQVAGEIESRKQHAIKAGLGFQLPEEQ